MSGVTLSVLGPIGQLEKVSNEISASHEHQLPEQLDGFERGSVEIKVDTIQGAAAKSGHRTASEYESGSVEYAVLEGDIVHADTLCPILFASDLSHTKALLSSGCGTVADGGKESSVRAAWATEEDGSAVA